MTVIPGVSSAIAGPALAGIPVTHRGVVQAFTVVSGHVPPGHPTSTTDWAALARAEPHLVVLMGVVHAPDEIERAVKSFSREPNGALLFLPDATVSIHREFITALVARHRLPAIYGNAAIAASGGLMSYGTDIVDLWQRAGSYVDRILRGEKPGDLPVQRPEPESGTP